MAATQRPIASGRLLGRVGRPPAWKNLPSWAVVAHRRQGRRHRPHPLDGRAGRREITEVDGSHVVMVSQPQAVADVILEAVRRDLMRRDR